tara:strand:- start:1354 stop:3165 length:1812 start_codon:yes stop_codon:yes gene_type:complete
MADIYIVYLIFLLLSIIPISRFGLLSIESIMLLLIYAPALSIAYMYINDGEFVNYQNMSYLQSGDNIFGYGLMLYLISFSTTIYCMSYQRNAPDYEINITKLDYLNNQQGSIAGFVLMFIAIYFFYKADPGGFENTILNTSYTDLLILRAAGTEYAYALGLISWIATFIIFLNNTSNTLLKYFFIISTLWITVWLGLHASRMPLSAILLSLCLYYLIKNKKINLILFILIGAISLNFIGNIREKSFETIQGLALISDIGSFNSEKMKKDDSRLDSLLGTDFDCRKIECIKYVYRGDSELFEEFFVKTQNEKISSMLRARGNQINKNSDKADDIRSMKNEKTSSFLNRLQINGDNWTIGSETDSNKFSNNDYLDENNFIYSPAISTNADFAGIDITIFEYEDIYKTLNPSFNQIEEIGYRYVENYKIANPKYDNLGVDDYERVFSLPGGISNIFMSFMITIDYFEYHDYFYGQTFLNYFTQLLPGPVNRYFDFENSAYFESSGVFDQYSWNGGINVISIFYANFGYFGLIIFGIFVHYYIFFTRKLLYSKNIFLLIISLFMFSTVMQVFWYELIQIIKPVLFIMLLNLFFLLFLSRRYERERPR